MAGRPRAFDEREVLDRAVALFWRNGFRGTTTRDLEHTLGLSQSSIYNAFGSKAELLSTVLDHYQEAMEAELFAPLGDPSLPGDLALREFFETLARWVGNADHRGGLLTNLMVENGGEDPELVKRSRAMRNRIRKVFKTLLVRGRGSNGHSKPTEADAEKAEVLLAMALGLVVAGRAGASRAELKRTVAAAHSIIG